MTDLRWSANLMFHPYVGPRYQCSDVRLLIVGESHYGFGPEDSDATQMVMNGWRLRTGKSQRYITVAARITMNCEATQIVRETAFDNKSWYNYVQARMDQQATDFSKAGPRSAAAFLEVIEQLDPTHILVTGKDALWKQIPPSADEGVVNWDGSNVVQVRRYPTRSGFASAMPIAHTTRASAPQWQPLVQWFLAN